MKRIRFREEQIVVALKRVEGGMAVKELCRELGVRSESLKLPPNPEHVRSES